MHAALTGTDGAKLRDRVSAAVEVEMLDTEGYDVAFAALREARPAL